MTDDADSSGDDTPGVGLAGYLVAIAFGCVFMAVGAGIAFGLSRGLDDRWDEALRERHGTAAEVRDNADERGQRAAVLEAWQAREAQRREEAKASLDEAEREGPDALEQATAALREKAEDFEPASAPDALVLLPEGRWAQFTALSPERRTRLFAGLLVAPVFFAPGFFIALLALVSMVRERSAMRLMREQPDRPWLHRSAWADLRGEGGSGGSIAGLAFMLFVFGWASGWATVFWLLDPDPPGGLTVAVVVGDLCAVLIALLGVRRLMQRRKYGDPQLLLAQVPYEPGKPLVARLVLPGGLPGPKLKARLKLQEVTTRGSGKNQRTHFETLLERDVEVLREQLVERAGWSYAELRFDVPGEARTSHYGPGPGYRWSLEVSAAAEGVDFDESFEIPVYVARAEEVTQRTAWD